LKQAGDNLRVSERYLVNHDSFYSLICLREALICLTAAHIMKHGLIPSFRPKELSLKLRLIKDKEKDLSAVFDLVNDVASLDYNIVDGLRLRLKEFVDAEWGTKWLGPRTELENAKSCVRRRDLIGAILSLRYSAYWLGFHILNKRGITHKKAEICNGENHVGMISSLATVVEPFFRFYKELQFAEKWDSKQVESAVGRTRTVLDNWQNR